LFAKQIKNQIVEDVAEVNEPSSLY